MKHKILNLDKDILYDLYINKRMTSKEVAKIFNCCSKSVKNYLRRFEIPIRPNGEAVKIERSKWSKEKERARSRKFITTYQNKSQEEKEKVYKKAHESANSPESIQKARETKLKNNSYRKSISEDNFYYQLSLFVSPDDIIRGFIDNKRYPYNCDFYIKSKDLFIEYQGHQTHGYEPYDSTNIKHIEYIHKMEEHKCDMKTWYYRDVNKLKKAKESNIKLLLIYPKNNSYLLKNGILNNIGKFNIVNINDID